MSFQQPNAIELFLGTQFMGAAAKAWWSVMVSEVSPQSWELRLDPSSLKLRDPNLLARLARCFLPVMVTPQKQSQSLLCWQKIALPPQLRGSSILVG